MASDSWKIHIVACLSVIAALMLLLTTLSHLPKALRETKDAITYLRDRRSVKVELADREDGTDGKEIHGYTELAKFAYKYRDQLEEFRSYRKTECGSIVSVSPVDCGVCKLAVDGLRELLKNGAKVEELGAFLRKVCIDLKIEDERVCTYMVRQYTNMVISTLIGITYESAEVCGMVLGTDCGAPYNPSHMWNVTFPDTPKPPVLPPTPPKPGSPTLRVLHITDFHFDTEYEEGTNAKCGEPLCCRPNDGPPAPGIEGAGKYGDYRDCDTPQPTIESLFQHLNATQDQFDFVIFTGDIPPHNVWNQTRPDQLAALDNYITYMQKYLPDKMIINAMGNHESAPCNSFPPPYVTGNNSESWLYDKVVPAWRNWLPQETEETIRRGGFYSFSPFQGFRVISLNMNMGYSLNFWVYINTTDPGGMLQWFISELQMAEDKGEKVYVLGHVYPGGGDCLKAFSWNYYKIVNRYENTIVGQFFGHTHKSIYEVFYDEETLKRPLGMIYIPGSITPFSHLNPGYRIYEIDGNYPGSSWRVQDYTNYFLNITKSNMMNKPVWEVEYNAKEEYGLEHLFPADWNDLIYRMKDDDKLFAKYCKHNVKSAPNDCDNCHELNCKVELLCQLKTGRSLDPSLCADLYD